MIEGMTWWNEPPEWSVDGDVLRVVTADRTDFWRSTFYGWITDNGHFFHRAVTGDFLLPQVNGKCVHVLFPEAAGNHRIEKRLDPEVFRIPTRARQ